MTAGSAGFFTYQGNLNQSGTPVSGPADLRFRLLDRNGVQVGGPVTLLNVPVQDGLFTVELGLNGEFGLDAFDGTARYLEVAVGVPAGRVIAARPPSGRRRFDCLDFRKPVDSMKVGFGPMSSASAVRQLCAVHRPARPIPTLRRPDAR